MTTIRKKDFTVKFTGEYIHIVHPNGYKITPQSMQTFWPEMANLCEKYQCKKILSEATKVIREMSTVSVHHSGNEAASILGLTMACCFTDYEPDENTKLFINVAHNRGAHIEFFKNKVNALKWLKIER